MRNILIRILPIILFFSISCFNETDEIIENELTTSIDYLIIDTAFIDYTFNNIINQRVFDSYFGSHQTNLEIDVNGDSINDICFNCSINHGTVYNERYASVMTLHDSVNINIEDNTNIIVKYSRIEPGMSENDSILFTYFENYDNQKEYPANMEIDTVEIQCPSIYSLTDTISDLGNWATGQFTLKSENHTSHLQKYNIKMDSWSSINRKFIAIRFLDKDLNYYGWIELSSHEKVIDYEVTLHRSGCKRISNGST